MERLEDMNRRRINMDIKGSIFVKIFIYFILVIICPSMSIGLSSYHISVNILKEKITEQHTQKLSNITQDIEEELVIIQNISDMIFLSGDVKNIITKYHNDANSAIDSIDRLHEMLQGLSSIQYNNIINNIEIYSTEEDVQLVYREGKDPIGNLQEHMARHEDAFKNAIRLNGKNYLQCQETLGEQQGHATMKVYRVIKDREFDKIIGVLYMDIQTEYFSKLLNDLKKDTKSNIGIFDKNQQLMAYSGDVDIKSHGKEILLRAENENWDDHAYEDRSTKELIQFKKIPTYDWKIVGTIPVEELIKDNKQILYVTIIAFAISFIISCIIWLIISYSILNPIRTLTLAMNRVREGNIYVKVDIDGTGEIRDLIDNFNFMTKRIDELFVTSIERNNRLKDEEYKALQAQINPHFLYNTLNSLRWMAIIRKDDSMKAVIDALSRLLRNTTSKTSSVITIHEEVENLKDYIYIQKLTYRNKFEVIWDIDEEVLSQECIKFILQPIVENAIFHGIEPKEGLGSITISITMHDDRIVFRVIDDGIGMNPQKIYDILQGENNSKDRFNSIGMNNVNERIKITYGQAYGIHIESVEGEYTEVRITVPKESKS